MKKQVWALILVGFFMLLTTGVYAQSKCSKHSKCSKKESATASSCDSKGSATVNLLKTGESTTISVKGNCGMCEKKIESSAKSVPGVKSADWDKSTKSLLLVASSDVDLSKVHGAISHAGYATGEKDACPKAYAALPGCCKYASKE